MFCIETGRLKLKLEIIRVESLFQHEEIIPRVVDRMTLEFKNRANLQNPIIVDESHIILDGNHRAFVFKKLQFKYIPVCKIDYFDEATKLRYWFRLLGNLKKVDILKDSFIPSYKTVGIPFGYQEFLMWCVVGSGQANYLQLLIKRYKNLLV